MQHKLFGSVLVTGAVEALNGDTSTTVQMMCHTAAAAFDGHCAWHAKQQQESVMMYLGLLPLLLLSSCARSNSSPHLTGAM
jgi:hypothetical protein